LQVCRLYTVDILLIKHMGRVPLQMTDLLSVISVLRVLTEITI
jgi:hypothetical protein